MNRKVLFYNIILYKNGNPTSASLVPLLKKIMNYDSNTRNKEVNKNWYKIFSINDNDNGTYGLRFAKRRNNKPLLGNDDSDQLELIDGELYETVNIIYDPEIHLIMLENYFNAPSGYNLERYINSFLKSEENTSQKDFYEIKSRIVKSDTQMELIKQSQYIKEINVDFIPSDIDFQRLLEGDYEDRGIIGKQFNAISEASKLFGLKVATLTLKKGRFRDPINMDKTISLIFSLDMDSDLIKSVKVTVKTPWSPSKVISLTRSLNLEKRVDIKSTEYLDVIKELSKQYEDNLKKDKGLNLENQIGNVGKLDSVESSEDLINSMLDQ